MLRQAGHASNQLLSTGLTLICVVGVCACRDALLRRITLRFVLCRAALTLHTVAGRNPAHLPTVFPELPKEVSSSQDNLLRLSLCSSQDN